jgi:hypothetical protein
MVDLPDHQLLGLDDFERMFGVELPTLPQSRSGAAARQRRLRARIRRHEIVCRVTLGARAIDALVGLQWLSEAETGDRTAIADAITRMLTDLAGTR